MHIPHNHLTRGACANEHYAAGRGVAASPSFLLQQDKAVSKPYCKGQQELGAHTDHIIGIRHTTTGQALAKQDRNCRRMEQSCDQVGNQNALKFAIARKPPHALVQVQTPEHCHTANGVNRHEFHPSVQILWLNLRECAVKPHPQGKEICTIGHCNIISKQQQYDQIPMLDKIGLSFD